MLKKVKILAFIISALLTCHLYAETVVELPKPIKKGNISLEETLSKRRSVREFSSEVLTLNEVSQLLWSAQGITGQNSGRTAPSAGALYPIKVYLVVGGVRNLNAGIYRYEPFKHQIIKIKDEDLRESLSEAALGQPWVKNAAVNLVITAIYEITTKKYGERGIRYVHIEAGHVAQNVLLQAVAIGLGAVPVGAFYDSEVKKVLGLKENEQPLYMISVGKKR